MPGIGPMHMRSSEQNMRSSLRPSTSASDLYSSNRSFVDAAVNKCVSTASVLEVNPSYGIRLADSSSTDGAAGFLCVVKDNNPTKGEFFSSVITPQSDKVLEANGVAPEFAFRPTPLATLSPQWAVALCVALRTAW